MSAHLDESTRLTIRNTLLANPDLDLDAAMSTAISHLLSPLLAAYVEARVAEALAPVRALADRWDALAEISEHDRAYVLVSVADDLRAALPEEGTP